MKKKRKENPKGGFAEFTFDPGIRAFYDRINGKSKQPLTRWQHVKLWFTKLLRREPHDS